MNYSVIKEICHRYKAEYLENQPLAQYTSFKIGGACPILIKPNGSECLCVLIREFKKENAPYRVMGKGSNLLISDKGIDTPVIMISSGMNGILPEETNISCGAGTSLSVLCQTAAELGLSGLEFAFGIPGSVGGALYMNAGAYGGEMKDVVVSCLYIDENGDPRTLTAEEMELSYRRSFFTGKKNIIVQVGFKLNKGDTKEISSKMKELMQRRRDKQPLEYPSAGSTFKRPEGDFAGRLIDAAGLRGYTVGGAQVSEKHCGFVVNKGNASFDDVKQIINDIKDKVKENSGIELAPEVIIWE